VYNAEAYVRQAVESALAQPETAEVLLIEDDSPDRSLKVCSELEKEYEKVRLLRHADGKNHGAGATRNVGIRNAQYDFIAFLDADDFYLPGRFEIPKKLFAEYDDIDGVYEAIGVHFNDSCAKEQWFHLEGSELTTMTEKVQSDQLFYTLLKGGKGYFTLDGLVVRKSIFRKCGHFFENLRLHQDTAMIIQMSAYGTLIPGRLDEPVAMRRVHTGNRHTARTYQTKQLYLKTLFNWAYERKLPSSKLSILFYRYLYCSVLAIKANNMIFSQNMSFFKDLTLNVLRHPYLAIRAIIRYGSFQSGYGSKM
jgi:glycosyltransferase involved in cell wall biosynthesis